MTEHELDVDLDHLFKRPEVRFFVKLVVWEDRTITIYKAEQVAGIPYNSGARHLTKWRAHLAYLHKRSQTFNDVKYKALEANYDKLKSERDRMWDALNYILESGSIGDRDAEKKALWGLGCTVDNEEYIAALQPREFR